MISQDLINKKLAELSKGNFSKSSYVKVNMFKPSEGNTIIRILPNKYSPDFPVVEKFMYYTWNGNPKDVFTSPLTFGEPDPIQQFSANTNDKAIKDALKVTREFIAPIIVRGKEAEGVKYFKIGKEAYKQLLNYISDDDYGDITSVIDGNDIVVNYTPKEKTANGFPVTTLMMKPKKTAATDDPELTKQLIESQIDYLNNGGVPTYEQLEDRLNTFVGEKLQGVTPAGETGTNYNDRFNKLTDSKSEDKKPTEYSAEALGDLDALFA